MISGIDAHIHLDKYDQDQVARIMADLSHSSVKGLIAVSMNRESCEAVHRLQQQYPKQVFPAYGYHPEQDIPTETELQWLFQWIRQHSQAMVAVGEVGLPYYMRKEAEQKNRCFSIAPYVSLLEQFILLAKDLNLPIVLHAVYEDADLACDLLAKHQVVKAHFHWFKGSLKTVQRMIQAGYMISITPDVKYEEEIRSLVKSYPLELLMVETDGPWPFEGPYLGTETHPRMIEDVIVTIAELKSVSVAEAAAHLLKNTIQFYDLETS